MNGLKQSTRTLVRRSTVAGLFLASPVFVCAVVAGVCAELAYGRSRPWSIAVATAVAAGVFIYTVAFNGLFDRMSARHAREVANLPDEARDDAGADRAVAA